MKDIKVSELTKLFESPAKCEVKAVYLFSNILGMSRKCISLQLVCPSMYTLDTGVILLEKVFRCGAVGDGPLELKLSFKMCNLDHLQLHLICTCLSSNQHLYHVYMY